MLYITCWLKSWRWRSYETMIDSRFADQWTKSASCGRFNRVSDDALEQWDRVFSSINKRGPEMSLFEDQSYFHVSLEPFQRMKYMLPKNSVNIRSTYIWSCRNCLNWLYVIYLQMSQNCHFHKFVMQNNYFMLPV